MIFHDLQDAVDDLVRVLGTLPEIGRDVGFAFGGVDDQDIRVLPGGGCILTWVGKPAPPRPTRPESRTAWIKLALSVTTGGTTLSCTGVLAVGFDFDDFHGIAGAGDFFLTALTVPETLAWIGTAIGASARPISWPTLTGVAGFDNAGAGRADSACSWGCGRLEMIEANGWIEMGILISVRMDTAGKMSEPEHCYYLLQGSWKSGTSRARNIIAQIEKKGSIVT